MSLLTSTDDPPAAVFECYEFHLQQEMVDSYTSIVLHNDGLVGEDACMRVGKLAGSVFPWTI